MIIELTLALIIGILCGTLTGLTPGIHINLVASATLANITLFSDISPLSIAIFIVALSITHTFIDFIPSIFLGAPEESTALSVLPGHQMLKEGKGYEASILSLQGALSAMGVGLVWLFVYIYFLSSIEPIIKIGIPFVLMFVSIYAIFREKNILGAGLVFLFAGFLGFFTFNLPIHEPLLPLLSGLFGISSLITSISKKESIPLQKTTTSTRILSLKEYSSSATIVSIVGPVCSFLPGIGSNHISFVSAEIIKQSKRQFLFLNGMAATLTMFLSFIIVYSIGKARTGSAAAVQELLQTISKENLIILSIAAVISALVAYYLGKYLAKYVARIINKVKYTRVSLVVLGIIVLVNICITNWIGLIVLVTASALGIWTIQSGIKRIHLMGALIMSTILYYLV